MIDNFGGGNGKIINDGNILRLRIKIIMFIFQLIYFRMTYLIAYLRLKDKFKALGLICFFSDKN